MTSERDLIAAIARRAAPTGPDTGPPGLLQGIGDDGAIWRPTPGTDSLITTDTMVEGVHFDRRWHPPHLLGRKAVAVNVSDIAAMGGTPRFALLSLGLAGDEEQPWREALLDGLAGAVQEYGATLIGGDTVRTTGGVMLSVTIIGECRESRACRRSGGRAGDSIWVGGPLGLAAAGLELCRLGLGGDTAWAEAVRAHLDPTAQVELGQRLADSGLIHAMMDISDGLATDLAHICTASGVGAEVEAKLLPTPPLVSRAAAECGADAITWALTGGEDYHLLFTAASEHDQAIARLAGEVPGAAPTRVGRLTEQAGVVLRQPDGQSREIGYGGYEHFRATP